MTEQKKPMRDLRIKVTSEIYEALEKLKDDEGHTTLQSFVAPVVNALGRGEIHRTYRTSGPTVGGKP
ncbi:hypothetical protein HER32_11965 [Hymenobacter sp. BT18]|uniref:hypothetical protein n=1 Tax=Hymenobacter sp. BT18 TaxID=2835648 RepID=UPI00143E2188|nr:hypothetical protein [Hymenobacter sp. BT18]QIX61858.1 hypothetical protein HER32_11965 [Hymenobacter sp. BT18]